MEKKNFRAQYEKLAREIVDETALLITEKGVDKLSIADNNCYCYISLDDDDFRVDSVSVGTRNDGKYFLELHFEDREVHIIDPEIYLDIEMGDLVSVYEATCHELGL